MKRGEQPAGGGGTARRGTKGPAARKKPEVASAALIRDLKTRNVELTRALAKLTVSRDAYVELYDFTPVGYFALDRDGRILQANLTGVALLGPDRASVVGRRFRTFVAEEGRRVLEEATRRFWAGETPGSCQVRLLPKEGKGIWVDIAFGPGPSEGRGARRSCLVVADITERKLAEEALRESETRLRVLYENSMVGILLTAPDGRIFSANPAACRMLGRAEAEISAAGRAGIVDPRDPNLSALLEERARTGSAEGTLMFIRGDGSRFPADVASVAFETGEGPRTSMMIRDIAERTRAEEELRRSKRELELAQQIALVGHWEWDIVGERLSWSDELYRIWGVPKGSPLTFRSIESLIHPDDRALNSASVRATLDSADDTEYEFRIVRPDGVVRYLHQRVEVTRDKAGKALSAFGIMQDITERRQTLEELNVQAILMDQLRDTITATDLEGRITYANRASYDMLGLEDGSLVGRTVHAYGEDPRRGATQDEIIAATRSTGQWRGLVVNKAVDGRETIRDLHTYVIRDERGNPTGMCGIGTDVTERTRVEEAYRSLVDNSLQGIAIIKDGRMVFCNQALSRLSGYSQEEACAMSAEQVMATVHPDDRVRVMQGMAELLAGVDVPSRQEMRLLTKDGRVRWVEVLSVRTSHGGRPALQVSYLDATERREAEGALRLSESRYRELFARMGAAVAVYEALEEGRDFALREFNPAAEKIGNLRAEDVLGRRVTEVFPGVADLGLLDVFRRVWRTGVPEHQEARLYSDPTHRGWRENYVYRLPTGEVVAVYEDVTERKRAEEELSRRSEQLARANTMLGALGRVAVLLQSDLDPDHIMRTLGGELASFGLSCFVALTEPETSALRVVYASMPPQGVSEVLRLCAAEARAFHVPRERLPSWVELLQEKRGVFVPDARQAGGELLSGIPDTARERVLELGGIGPATAAAALPLAVGEEVAGVLAVWGADLREADLPALTVFAGQVAVSLHNASMFEQAQVAHDRLRDLTRHLQSAREEERSAAAREIHDELGQILTALKIDLRWLAKRLDPDRLDLAEKTSGMIELADQMIEATQRLASKLRPRMLDDLGLVAAVEWLAGEHRRLTGIPCEVDVQITESRIGPSGTTALFRIVQEALSNVARHAEASHVMVRLRESGAVLEVLVRDDGIGIAAGRTADPHSFGLMGIRERAMGMGGQACIHGEPGKGTSILVTVPLPAGEALP